MISGEILDFNTLFFTMDDEEEIEGAEEADIEPKIDDGAIDPLAEEDPLADPLLAEEPEEEDPDNLMAGFGSDGTETGEEEMV